MEVLIGRGNESPYFQETRLPFLRQIVEQRTACGGIEAILSSVIELFPHQIRTAVRILGCPVQRVLLADEVGLGKTIEAGIVARQYLLDHPNGSLTVVTPDVLRRQ